MSYYKYPRTPHLPWSAGATIDDERIVQLSHFVGRQVVVSEKMDGENTTLYRDHVHARSLDSRHHPSRDWLKQWHAKIRLEIPQGWRVCGENLYAKHSISYHDLESFFYGFSIWNSENQCLSWPETIEWFDLLNIVYPRILYQGLWHEERIRQLRIDEQLSEGYVIRTVDGFAYQDFAVNVAKYVRAHHVQTTEHWMFAPIIPNRLQGAKS